MDPRRILTFRVVARLRSFSEAARELHVSQPSISQQVAQLETEAGVRLFDRGKGGLRLTHAGETLLVHAENLAWRLDLARTQIASIATDSHQQLRIGSFPTALAGFIPASIGRLRASDPDMRITVTEVTPSTLDAQLFSGALDLAVTYQDSDQPRREHDDATRIDLLAETFLLAMTKQHRLAHGTGPVDLSDLADDEWVVPSLDGFIARTCREAGFEPRVAAVTQDPRAMHGMIMRGIAVGMIPSLLVDSYPEIAVRTIRGRTPSRDIYALLPPGEPHHHADHVIAALRAAADETKARHDPSLTA